MIDWYQALILAIIQGLTEFLPISSSAHLVIPALVLGWQDQGLAFDVAVHLGTLAAVLGYFRRDLLAMLRSFFAGPFDWSVPEIRLIWCLVLASLPVAVVGYLGADLIETNLRGLLVIVATTALFGLLLGLSEWRARSARHHRPLTPGRALLVGLAQTLALIPGVSRSGVTITAALFLDMDRTSAARFSFLLSIPTIVGAGLLKGIELLAAAEPVNWSMMLLPAMVSALVAYATIAMFLRLIERVGLMPFVWYRLLLAAILLVFWQVNQ